ncbi:MAG: hypothetical protein AB8B45_05210, partial [Prochlorococcus sp.]
MLAITSFSVLIGREYKYKLNTNSCYTTVGIAGFLLPRIAVKAKAPFGIGVVFAYASEPNKFYYRELIPKTKRC